MEKLYMNLHFKTLQAKIQVKLSHFISKLSSDFSRPDQKFLHDMLCGLLKGAAASNQALPGVWASASV